MNSEEPKGESAEKSILIQTVAEKKELLDPEEWLPHLTLTHYGKVVDRGNEHRYQPELLLEMPDDFVQEKGQKKYGRRLEDMMKTGPLNLASTIRLIKGHYSIYLFYCYLSKGVNLLFPFLLKSFITWFESEDLIIKKDGSKTASSLGLWLIIVLAFCLFFRTILTAKAVEKGYKVKLVVNNIIGSQMVLKVFKMQRRAASYLGYGKIVVLVNNDVSKVIEAVRYSAKFFSESFDCFFCILFIYMLVGPLCLIGLVLIILFSFLQKYIFKKYLKLDKVRRGYIDKRSGVINEVVTGIKSVKFNASENILNKKLSDIRDKELSLLSRMFERIGQSLSISWSVSPAAGFLIFSYCRFFTTKKLSVGTLFAVLMYLNKVGYALNYIADALSTYYSSQLSFKRLDCALRLPEDLVHREEDKESNYEAWRIEIPEEFEPKPGSIQVEDYNGSWDDFEIRAQLGELMGPSNSSKKTKKEENGRQSHGDEEQSIAGSSTQQEDLTLENITFNVAPGEFVALIGKIGSGKSSLLQAIAGVLKKHSGTLRSGGSIALVSQQAFLVNDTLKNNILFGKEYDEKKYQKILKICQLQSDLDILPSGDQTEIGERGINLSGGQKQRVSLARAVYSDSDIFLIDDCLSALDAHVGKAVLDEVLLGYLKGKTVIMASHHTHFLDEVDKVILMDKGRISLYGKYEDIKGEKEFLDFVFVEENKKKEGESDEEEQEEKEDQEKVEKKGGVKKANDGRLTAQEVRQEGIVGFDVFTFYMKSGGLLFYCLILAFFTLSIGSLVLTDWWAGKWFRGDFRLTEAGYMAIYTGLILSFMVFSALKSYAFGRFAPLASYKIFKTLIWKVMRKPMSFFDTTPSGVIINRAVDDMETGDLSFPKYLFTFQDFFFIVLATCFLVVYTSWVMIIIIAGCSVMIYLTFLRFLRASTELKRIFRVSRSPVLTTVSEMVNGMTTIRLYDYQDHLKYKWVKNHDLGISAQLHEGYCIAWISLYIYLSIFTVAILLCLSVVYRKYSRSLTADSAVEVALVLQYVLSLTGLVIRIISAMGSLMTEACMIERLKEFCEMEGFEAELEREEDSVVPGDWPTPGRINIENFSVRYREGLPLIIKGLNLKVEAGTKVAILGRTGSGKSTLMLALMRILEASESENRSLGRIEIDGVDISKIGLHKLRKNISIIPQDPFLLEGSLRFNLDQFGLVSDAEMLEVLQKIQFTDSMKGNLFNQPEMLFPEKKEINLAKKKDKEEKIKGDSASVLDFNLDSKGRNLSVGQRQLI